MNPQENVPQQQPQVAPPPVGQPMSPGPGLPPTPPVSVPPTPGAVSAPSSPSPKESRKKLITIVAIVSGVLALIAGLVLAWFLILSPPAKAKSLSNSFMKSITTGDVDKAVEITRDENSRTYLKLVAGSVEGDFKLIDSTYKNDKGYYLYSLTGADKEYARTAVGKEDGKLAVTSFVIGHSKMGLIPGEADEENVQEVNNNNDDSDKNSSSGQTETTAPTACLGPDDFKALLSTYTVKPDSDGKYTYGDSFFFNADTAEYAYPSVMASTYEKYKTFYAQKSSKDFTITLRGEVNSAEKDDVLANQRAEKVKADLIALSGIPASRIVIGTPTNEAADPGTGSSGSANRTVDVNIESSDNCKK